MLENASGRPYINIVFGNFYSPAYDDEAFVDRTMRLVKELGFHSVMFDTKAWEDFKERCEGGACSQYVKMQEYMGRSAHAHGLAYNFLLLYMNGDNLYPHIRFSPPIYGEQTVGPDGAPGRWYKYWSQKARASMKAHVERIMERYGAGCEQCVIKAGGETAGNTRGHYSRQAQERTVLPVCSMWDPVVMPSFDEEGKERYLQFLEDFYEGDIDALNQAYGTAADHFFQLQPQEYWYTLRYGAEAFFSQDDVRRLTTRFLIWRDNAVWRMRELAQYFRAMHQALKARNPELYLCPNMSQWGYFLNIYGREQADMDNAFSDLWDTALRGIDLYEIADDVDACHFMAAPVTPDGYADAYVVSCQHSMMRALNEKRPVIGGVYWGRYIYNDLYAYLTPEQVIGSMAACGIDGYTSYGINGLDDGGVLNRMEDSFLDSLARGNAWLADILPLRKGSRKKEIALLFPSEMALLEPFEVGDNKIRRLDLLGWYKLCCDLGYQVDVISSRQIAQGRLADYRILIAPANDCYHAFSHTRGYPQKQAQEQLKAWVGDGGVFVHGPFDGLAQACFGIAGQACEKMPYRYEGTTIIAQGEAFCTYQGCREVAAYLDGSCCVGVYEGAVYSFGVQVGAAYASKNIPHVPYGQQNREMYPFVLSKTTLVKDILRRYCTPASGICERGIETGVFEGNMVIVNHRPVPYQLPRRFLQERYQRKAACTQGEQVLYGRSQGEASIMREEHTLHGRNQNETMRPQDENGVLAAHSAVWVSW